jgi:hypothetical protein
MIIERLSQEHRSIEKLLAILERQLEVFDRGDRPDYEVIRAVISSNVDHRVRAELMQHDLSPSRPRQFSVTESVRLHSRLIHGGMMPKQTECYSIAPVAPPDAPLLPLDTTGT